LAPTASRWSPAPTESCWTSAALKAKAGGEGLTDEEAAELGRLYAEGSEEPYHYAGWVRDADASSEDKESRERRKLEAVAQAEATQERDRSQALPTGEAPEADSE
jgi:hypothetical protein